MHTALFIDEILRNIFELCFQCTDGGKPNLHDLCRVARCCKTWKDPALDTLWRRLSCVTPLLSLILGLSRVDGVYVCDDPVKVDLSLFHSYARRVKHIAHHRYIRIHPDVISLLTSPTSSESTTDILPSLTTANISSIGCSSLQPSLSISKRLTCLYLDVGFTKTRRGQGHLNQNGTADAVCELLEQVARVAPAIERISLRGRAFTGLNSALSSMTRLRVISLRTGKSLAPEALATISRLPLLAELELHTGPIEVEELSTLSDRQYSSSDDALSWFPSLQKLHVRGHIHLIEYILGHLYPGTLHTLYIEAEDLHAITWDAIFMLIASKATHTLEALTVEHHIDLDSDAPSPLHQRHPTLATLGPLASLRNLRRFTIDTSLPPDLCDADVAHLAAWWPMIEYLVLGYIEPTLECAPREGWRPRATLASLASFARRCPRLGSLTLPIDVKGFDFDLSGTEGVCQEAMQRLSTGSREGPDDVLVAQYLGRLFPELSEVWGLGHDEEWKKVERTLLEMREMRSEGSCRL